MTEEARQLAARLEAARAEMEERLLQEPGDDELRDLLVEVEEAIGLLAAEDAEAPLSDLAALESRIAEKLQS